jgi:hypothetical protein
MDLRRAATYVLADHTWPRKVGLIALVSPVPVLGQLYALGYANLTLRRILKSDDSRLPDAKLGWELFWLGLQVALVTLICGIVVGFLGAPLFIGQDSTTEALAPALIQAVQGPSALLITTLSTVITAVVLARFAQTHRISGGFEPVELWKLLRAEPAIWISYAVVGYLLTEGPYAVAWMLPLHGGWDIFGTLVACTVLWTYGLMVNIHLIAQAYTWSHRTAALRAAHVRYRW